jgi:NADH:ubiquinone oxidoreductase subunit 5 (subunit L)/multisubunit Na+/H+ antiporter MnhA subunit
MNKMHSLTKIILTCMGIYFAILLISQILFALSMAIAGPSRISIIALFLSLLFAILYLAALFYLFFYKREKLAERIVGTDSAAEPDSQIQWLPVAFRLASVIAGLYCLQNILWHIMRLVDLLFTYNQNKNVQTFHLSLQEGLSLSITLIFTIYLLCGAPHFVRWHVKKILAKCGVPQQCNKPSQP